MKKEQSAYTLVFARKPSIFRIIILYITGWKKTNEKLYKRLGD